MRLNRDLDVGAGCADLRLVCWREAYVFVAAPALLDDGESYVFKLFA